MVKKMFNIFDSLTKKDSGSCPAGFFHGNASVLQSPVNTLKELLLLRVHLLHLTVTDAKKLVVKFIKPADKKHRYRRLKKSQVLQALDCSYKFRH